MTHSCAPCERRREAIRSRLSWAKLLGSIAGLIIAIATFAALFLR